MVFLWGAQICWGPSFSVTKFKKVGSKGQVFWVNILSTGLEATYNWNGPRSHLGPTFLFPKKFGLRIKIIVWYLYEGPKFVGDQVSQRPNFLEIKKVRGPNEIGDHFNYSWLGWCPFMFSPTFWKKKTRKNGESPIYLSLKQNQTVCLFLQKCYSSTKNIFQVSIEFLTFSNIGYVLL